ncbi:MAG: ATP-binding protein [Desulfobacteraceae bacterium]|nr:ATP-binding protein [Desulfobacteraceae bacterium]
MTMTEGRLPETGVGEPRPKRRAQPRPAPRRCSAIALLSPRSIRGKLILSVLFISFLGSLASFLTLYSLSRMQGKIALSERFYELNQTILETRRYEKNFLLYGNQADLASALNALDQVRASLEVLRATPAVSQTMAAMLPRQKSGLDAYADLMERLHRKEALPAAAYARMREELREQGHILTQSVLEIDTQARQEVERSARRYRDIALSVLLFALVSVAGLTLLLVHWIIGPLRSIRTAAARIMRGELAAIPLEPSCHASVECEQLVDALNLMLHALEITRQNQLVQSAKLAELGRVAAGIAHEINNPLNNICLTAEVLIQELSDLSEPDRQEMVHDILSQADRAREVVHHLLDFSRPRESAAQEEVEVVALLQATLALLHHQIRLGRIRVHTDLPASPLPVTGNPNQLEQVFVNIVLNAIQAMGPGGTLTLRAREADGKVLLDFTDTGPGIPEETRARIFDPFFTTKSEGTGLGLSVSSAIIREHQGEIVLDSDPQMGTTTFRIVLPLRRSAASA